MGTPYFKVIETMKCISSDYCNPSYEWTEKGKHLITWEDAEKKIQKCNTHG